MRQIIAHVSAQTGRSAISIQGPIKKMNLVYELVGFVQTNGLARNVSMCNDLMQFCRGVPSPHSRPGCPCRRSTACVSSRPRPAIRASPAPPTSSASPRPPWHTASARWSSISTSRCSTAAIAACASTAAVGPISRRCSASSPRSTASPNASAASPAGSGSSRSRRVAEKWLLPRLASFKADHPGIAIELETNHRGVDPTRRDFDAWLAYTGETAAPRPLTRREDTLLEETLYEEDLLPVCSPALLAARGRPCEPADLHGWPLLYDLGWDADWSYWFARQGQPTPDLSQASGFRLYSMLVQAAVNGIRRRHRPPHADRAGTRTQNAGPPVRASGRGARTLLPHHHRRRPATARSSGVPEMDPARGQRRGPRRGGRRPVPPVSAAAPPASWRARVRVCRRTRRAPAVRRCG